MFGRRRIARAEAARDDRLVALLEEATTSRRTGDGISPLQLPIVVACRRLIANTIAQLPLVAMRNRRPIATQPAIVMRPDPYEPRWLTMSRVVDNLTKWGQVWLRPTVWDSTTGWPNALRVYDANQGTPTFDTPTGDLTAITIDSQRYDHGPDGAIWVPYEVAGRGQPGTPPLWQCWDAVEYLAALYDMAGSFWEAGFPSVAVKVGIRLNADDTAKLKGQILSAWARRHEPAILDNGAELAQVGASAVESQLIESIGVANAEIARTFGVMPSLVNVAAGDSLTYSTTEGEFTKWLAVGLGPYLTRIEAAWSDLLPYGQLARFDTAVLTRADFATRAQAYNVALGGQAWLTPDEVRDREGLTPLGGRTPSPTAGDAITIPDGAHA